MAAPIGLAISKIIHPETRHTKANWETIRNFLKGLENKTVSYQKKQKFISFQ